jgi:hypothetical protein
LFLIAFQEGDKNLLMAFLWLSAEVAGRRGGNPCNSRFGGINSRLASHKFPTSPLREFNGKRLICPIIFVVEWCWRRQNRRNSRLHGNNREIALSFA